MKYILTEDGKLAIEGNTGIYQYFIADHLGNTRLVIAEPDSESEEAEIGEVNHYYPFGMRMGFASSKKLADQKYLYNRKELQEETGFLDYD